MQWLHMSSKEYREWGKESPSKYHAQKTVIDGVTYDSKKESRRAQELEYLQKIGKISNLQRQVRFVLQEGFVNYDKEKVHPIYYIADFCYTMYGVKIVEDVKSPATRTQVYLIKKKLFQFKYPEYKFIES